MHLNSVTSLRGQAVEVAFAQFSATGELSMRKVADQLSVTATALYHHFANKQALLDAVADRAFPDFEKRLRSTKATEPAEIVRGILDSYRQFAADEPYLFGLMFVDTRRSARKFPADFAAHRSAVFNLLWKGVNDCIALRDTVGSEDSLYLAHDLWALAHGQILLWRAGRFVDEPTFRKVLSRAIDRFIDTL
jgi:AcrR family transcriptional regulator